MSDLNLDSDTRPHMFIPEETTANGIIAAITGAPGVLFALSLSQTELAVLGIAVNVVMAFVLKLVDVRARLYFEDRRARRAAKEAGSDA